MSTPSILVINPNTTASVTERFVAECRLAASDEATFVGVTGTFGARIVSTAAEEVIAAHAALELLAQHLAGHDALILAISFDSGLEAARELVPVPVVGITEAALLAASVHGLVGLVTLGSVSRPLYERLVLRYRFEDRVVGIETIEIDSASGYLAGSDRETAMTAASRRLVSGGAAAIVICGAAMAGAAARLQPAVGVPVFDSAAPAVARVRDLLLQPPAPHAAAHPISTTSGISPELSALIEGRGIEAGSPRPPKAPRST